MNSKTYTATYDKGARWTTIVFGLFILLMLGFSASGIKGTLGLGIVALVPVLVGAITFRFSVKYYKILPDAIVVCRHSGEKVFSRQAIREVKIVSPDDLKGTMRTMGVGGLFGYYGSFSNNKFGDMTWYMTNRQHLIGIFLNDNSTVIISPDDAEQFYNDWTKQSQTVST
jgi:hypothetical protein